VEEAIGRADEAADYLHRADEVFGYVQNDVSADAGDIANAIVGQGNILHERGQFEAAISRYKDALKVLPGNHYALHDIFAAYDGLARQGKPNLKEMRNALEELKAAGARGMPGLSGQYLASLEERMQELERNATGNEQAT